MVANEMGVWEGMGIVGGDFHCGVMDIFIVVWRLPFLFCGCVNLLFVFAIYGVFISEMCYFVKKHVCFL